MTLSFSISFWKDRTSVFTVIFWCLLISISTASAASVYSSRLWQMEDGLPHNIVQAITQTRDGYLWVGTREGLARFNGVAFEIVNLPLDLTHPNISALHGSKAGDLWIGTDTFGLLRLVGGKVSRLKTPSGTKDYAVSEIEEDTDGAIWINSSEGILRMESEGLVSTGLNRAAPISHGVDGTVWAAFDGLKQLRGNTVTNYAGQNIPNGVRKLLCGRDGVLWAGLNRGLVRIEDGVGRFFKKGEGPGGYVSVICDDREGNIWIGSYLGLSQFVDGQFITQNENEEGFYRVYSIFQDREGSMWIGSEEGLSRLTLKRFTTYTKRQGLTQNNVVTVCPSYDGSVWIGVWGAGIHHLKDGEITIYNRTNGLSSDFVMALCEGRDKSLWIGTDVGAGLNRLKDGVVTRYDKTEGWVINPKPVITALVEDEETNLWVGTREGANRLKDGKFTRYTTKEGLNNNKINAICQGYSGIIWFGTDEGVNQWNNTQFVNLSTNQPRLKTPVLSLYEDDEGTLWIGTKETGLVRFKNGKFDFFTTRQGLFSEAIYSILEDSRKNLWLSTSKGIFYVSKKELEEVARGVRPPVTSTTFGKTDGIISSGQYREVTQPAACKATDGRLWFRTTQGVAVVDPEKISINRLPPSVVVEAVIADKKPVRVHGAKAKGQSQNETLNIKPGRGELEIHYSALSFRAPEKNKFKYKLEGFDREWVDADTRRVAYYNNLSPGNYRFQVIACNNDGVWNQTGATVPMILKPHFWQTWWFLGVCGMAATGLVGGTARYVTRKKLQRKLERLEQQHAIEKERSRIARDMHDELGAKLTRISFQGASAQRRLTNPVEVGQQIEKMSQTARELVLSLDEIVWAVDPENDSLENLANYICRHASEFFENSPVACEFVIPAKLPDCRLATDVRHNVFLAVKEVLNNVLKHSGAVRVKITISAEVKIFKIIIADNGRGIAKDESEPKIKRTGHGLTNIRERMNAIAGELKMENESGTRIEFIVPMREKFQ
ncbi:MAG: two-component regulator propeller domain-containing protein [Verrucomicrobiota bacterium]